MEQRSQNQQNIWTIPIAILIAGLIFSGSIYYVRKNEAAGITLVKSSPDTVSNHETILGDSKAPVTLIEYADYQCPFCGKFFNQIEPKLRDEYIKTGKLRMVYRDFSVLGAESDAAANASQCAEDQGKFWDYHDGLYMAESKDGKENNGNLNRDLFLMLAQSNGLDMTAFTNCIDSNKYIERIKQESKNGLAMGLPGTPTNYIDGKQVAGLQPYSVYKTLIDVALQKK